MTAEGSRDIRDMCSIHGCIGSRIGGRRCICIYISKVDDGDNDDDDERVIK